MLILPPSGSAMANIRNFYIKEEDRFANNEWVTYNPHQLWADGKQSYFIDKDGHAVSGWQKLEDGKWYHFSESDYHLIEGPCDTNPELEEENTRLHFGK